MGALFWTAEADDMLRRLWAQDAPKLSAQEIGLRLRTTKNAVVGRAHRLQLAARPSPIREAQAGAEVVRAAKERAAKSVATRTVTMAVGAASVAQARVVAQAPLPASPAARPVRPLPVGLRPATLSPHKTCQMIQGEARGAATRFCGKPALDGRSWCSACAARVFTLRPTWAA